MTRPSWLRLRHDPVGILSAFFLLYCVTLHTIEGVLIYVNPETIKATAVYLPILLIGSNQVAGVAFLVAAFLAGIGIWIKFPLSLLLLMPQQVLLLLCASGVVSAVVMEQFASGPHFPWYQILTEQLNVILVSVFHASAIVMRAVLSIPLRRRHEYN